MSKVITLRYAGKCRICNLPIPAGSRANWFGSKRGQSHIDCEKSPASKVKSQPETTAFNYADLRRDYISSVESLSSNEILKMASNRNKWNDLMERRKTDDGWSGLTNDQMLNILKFGYQVPGLDGVDSVLMEGAPRRKTRFMDEGDEMMIDMVLSGESEHFMVREKRYSKPSLNVKIGIAFSSIIPQEIVNAYQSWCARMLQTIDAWGLQMQVDLLSPGMGQFGSTEKTHTVVIRVKESGEASDFANWSPMFSPGGFRHLTFLGIIQSADRAGMAVSHGLGRPTNCKEWDVEYDKETNELLVLNNNDHSAFPEFIMTQKLVAVLNGIRNG